MTRRSHRQVVTVLVGIILLVASCVWRMQEYDLWLLLPSTTTVAMVKNDTNVSTTATATPNDGCGLYATTKHSVHWSPASESSTPASTSSKNSSTSYNYLQQVNECAKRFKWSYTADNEPNDNNMTDSHAIWQELTCQVPVTHETLISVIQQHDAILLAGDSVMRQQYFVLLCMVNPAIQVQDLSLYNPRDRKKAKYDYPHHTVNTSNAQNATTTTTTTLFYVPYGYIWQPAERNLYMEAVPHALRTYSNRSAIVLDSSRHYDSTRGHLLEKAVTFIAEQSTTSAASVYYMEPTPEEWPTTNGMFTDSCHGKCACQVLTEAQLRGRGGPHLSSLLLLRDTAPHNTSRIGSNQHDDDDIVVRQDVGKLPVPPTEFFERLYPDLSFLPNHNNMSTSNQSSLAALCIPDCLPATWRMDLVRYTLQQDMNHYSETTTSTSNANQRQFHKVNLVPTFWQLVARNQPSSRKRVGDCTHRSFDALVMMNQQLIRTMMMH